MERAHAKALRLERIWYVWGTEMIRPVWLELSKQGLGGIQFDAGVCARHQAPWGFVGHDKDYPLHSGESVLDPIYDSK